MSEDTATKKKNRRLMLRLVAVPLAMFGFGFAMVPLYQIVCDVTGIDGRSGTVTTEQVAAGEVDESRTITVEFVGMVRGELPWDFRPGVRTMEVHPGELKDTIYTVANRSDDPVYGQAVPSVSPSHVSRLFNKTECFCFTEQRLDGGESREMPVRFVIDPDIPEDVNTVTLSYTFFEQGTKQPVEGLVDASDTTTR